ncbi:MAG: GNAT family N-acetyltransferase [Myxococcota bacterium]
MTASLPLPITTPRLRLAAYQQGDERALAEVLDESWESMSRWLNWLVDRARQTSVEHCRRRVQASANRIATWWQQDALELKVTDHAGRLVGNVGLYKIDWRRRKFSIGYWTRTSQHGQGIATEACNALLRFAFGALSAKGVGLGVHPENHASLRVVEKCGFTRFAIQDGNPVFVLRSPDPLPSLSVHWG